MPLPPPPDSGSPYGSDWSVGAVLGSIGVIWVGDIPLPEAWDLVGRGWTVIGEALPAIISDVLAPAAVIGAIVIPGTLGSGELDYPGQLPAPPIPAVPPLPVAPPIPDVPPTAAAPPVTAVPPSTPAEVDAPPEPAAPPDVFVGPPPAVEVGRGGSIVEDYPPARVDAPAAPPLPFPEPGELPWPMFPPLLPSIAFPAIPKVAVPTVAPAVPATLPTISVPAVPAIPALPSLPLPALPLPTLPLPAISLPSVVSAGGLATMLPTAPGLTGISAPPVESANQCETPQQRQDRRDRKREDCRRLVTIRIRAHTKRVCMSDAALHEYRKAKRRLISKAKRELIGGTEKKLGLRRGTILVTPGQARRKLRKLIRVPTMKIPGTDIGVDVNPIIRGKP